MEAPVDLAVALFLSKDSICSAVHITKSDQVSKHHTNTAISTIVLSSHRLQTHMSHFSNLSPEFGILFFFNQC